MNQELNKILTETSFSQFERNKQEATRTMQPRKAHRRFVSLTVQAQYSRL
jgi:hypothetical protein